MLFWSLRVFKSLVSCYNDTMIITFTLEGSGNFIIKVGQKVEFNDPLFEKKESKEVRIPLAQFLHIPPTKIFKTLKKFVGEDVKKGDLLAEKKGFLFHPKYHSEHDGIIKEINHHDGSVVLEIQTDESSTINAFFKGEIASLENNTVTLKLNAGKTLELRETSHTFGGSVLIANIKELPNLAEDEVTNKIIFTEKIAPYELVKLEALGSQGFITSHQYVQKPSLPSAVLKNIDEFESVDRKKFPYCIINKDNNTIYFYA